MASWAPFRLFAIVLATIPASGCELVEGIFQAGMAVGIIMVILVVGLIVFLAGKLRTRV